MKKIILALMLMSCFVLVGCGGNSDKKEDNKQSITLEESDIKIINDTLVELTKGTAYEGSEFKIKMDDKRQGYISVSSIKPIVDIMSSYGVSDSDQAVKSIRKSLTFDSAFEIILSELNKGFEGMKVYIYDNEDNYNKGEFYTYKNIK